MLIEVSKGSGRDVPVSTTLLDRCPTRGSVHCLGITIIGFKTSNVYKGTENSIEKERES